ncbi:DMP19 family protein [Intestinibacter sp.]|uniref:DMP19 family protein n=1 Tax=Intestinibacter sp. TaxID=1965304 RepID=UPI002A76409C|nr:hypothetical protein [Intestinibacter sp.]MDY2736183.1 hypothetical protein [Intestinibacter sp.]
MNFIDEALKSNLHGDDFLQAMADIYKEPDVIDILDRYPKFIKDVILIIDYDTTLAMDGLWEVVNGNIESEFAELLIALDNCGAIHEANILRTAQKLAPEQEDEFEKLYDELALNNDYDGFWDLVREYIDKNLDY